MKVVHTIVNTFTSKRFVEPLVKVELKNGVRSQILIDPIGGDMSFLDLLIVKFGVAKFDFTVNPFKFLFRIVNIYFLIRKMKPEMIVCHMTKGAFIPLISSRLAGVNRIVYYNHGVPYPAYKGVISLLLKLIEYINCLMATEIIVVNALLIPDLQILTNKQVCSISPGSVCGISDNFRSNFGNPIETPKELAYLARIDQKKIFLYVGRPHSRKGFHLLLDCFKHLDEREDLLLLIAGCNKEDLINYLGCELRNVYALGMVLDLIPFYHFSDFIVLPSYHEGFPMSILEGIALGCIPIASSIKELDLVCESINSFRFELNLNSFSGCILDALNLDEATLAENQKQAHLASAKFAEDKVINNYFSFLYK